MEDVDLVSPVLQGSSLGRRLMDRDHMPPALKDRLSIKPQRAATDFAVTPHSDLYLVHSTKGSSQGVVTCHMPDDPAV